jgi:hypothetical protein
MQTHQLRGQSTDRRRGALLAGKLHGAIQVLEQRSNMPLYGFETALGHLRGKYLQGFRVGKPTAQCFGQQARIHA